jgi:hypothetical protein
LSLLDILRTDDLRWMRLLMWTTALAAETNVLVRQMQRPLLATRARGYELAILTGRGVMALLCLALIAPQTGGPDGWKYFFPCGALLVLSGSLLRWHMNRQIEAQKVAPPLRPAIERIRARNARVIAATPIGVAGAFALFAFVMLAPDRAIYAIGTVMAFSAYGLTGTLMSLHNAHRDFEMFEDAVDQALAAEEAASK